MEFKDAVKKVRASKAKENFFLFRMGYDTTLVLPHSHGVAVLAALEYAELLAEPYGENKTISGIDKETLRFSMMSRAEYEQIKIAALLGVSTKDVAQHGLEIDP